MMQDSNTMEVQENEALQAIADMYRRQYEQLLYKVHGYYREELVLRGDKIMNREYKEYFGLE